jgi:hypothetical protein
MGRCPFGTEKCKAYAPPFVEVEKDHWIECHYDIDFGKKLQVEFASQAA